MKTKKPMMDKVDGAYEKRDAKMDKKMGVKEDSKKDKALMDMQALNTAYQSYKLKTDEDLSDISQLAPYMTQGTSALSDPYGNRYQIRPMSSAEQQDRIQFFTVIKGEEIFWPRK